MRPGRSIEMLGGLTLGVIGMMSALPSPPAAGVTIVVSTTAEFRSALAAATAGTTVSVRPGNYEGGYHRRDLIGTAAAPVVITAADPAAPPVFVGGSDGLGLSHAQYVTLRDLVFERAQQNGINVDDGQRADTSSHHVTFTRVVVRDIPNGNRDGIKLSGVNDFVIENTTIERWGSDGSAVDMVGCHRGVIRNSVFRHTPGMPVGNGLQMKGGTTTVTITGNRFEHAAGRAVQLGGETGLQFFRPQPPGPFEVKDVVVERNVFVGGETAVAFVSSDGGIFRFNTIYLPTKYLFRILQENDGPGFVHSRNGVFSDNIVYWTGTRVVNIGANTEPASFTLARNAWYRADDPAQSRPELPSPEVGGLYGVDPQFVAAPVDLHTRLTTPRGAYAR
jgi:hypothetical protein